MNYKRKEVNIKGNELLHNYVGKGCYLHHKWVVSKLERPVKQYQQKGCHLVNEKGKVCYIIADKRVLNIVSMERDAT
jgi:hypothetical protein